MERSVAKEEWWPVWELVEPNKFDPIMDVPDDLVERYNQTRSAFNMVQDEIWKLMGYAD